MQKKYRKEAVPSYIWVLNTLKTAKSELTHFPIF